MLPTWDLFIIVFFIIITAYSFLIGKEKIVKVMIAAYLAILTADGVGNLFFDYFVGPAAPVRIFPSLDSPSFMVLFKILFFIIAIVFLVMNSGFEVNVTESNSKVVSWVVTTVLGVLSAAMLITTILIYASGASLIFHDLIISSAFQSIVYDQSFIARWLMDNASIVLSVPALLFFLASVFAEKSD